MAEISVIKNADWVVSWNTDNQHHEYMQDADVVFKNSEIIYVGKNYNDAADHEIDGNGLCVMPGLINLHSHTL